MKELTKGQVAELTKEVPGLNKVMIGLGWDVNNQSGAAYDLDASAVILDASGKIANNKQAVFFQNKTSEDGSVAHSGDNLTGAGDGDDEQINVNLAKVTGNRVDVVVTLYQAAQRNQSLKNINNAFMRIVNAENGQEISRFKITGTELNGNSVLFGSLLKGADGNWSFSAEGKELAGEITQVLTSYGYAA